MLKGPGVPPPGPRYAASPFPLCRYVPERSSRRVAGECGDWTRRTTPSSVSPRTPAFVSNSTMAVMPSHRPSVSTLVPETTDAQPVGCGHPGEFTDDPGELLDVVDIEGGREASVELVGAGCIRPGRSPTPRRTRGSIAARACHTSPSLGATLGGRRANTGGGRTRRMGSFGHPTSRRRRAEGVVVLFARIARIRASPSSIAIFGKDSPTDVDQVGGRRSVRIVGFTWLRYGRWSKLRSHRVLLVFVQQE